MLRILHNTNWDVLAKWRLSFITVLVFVVPALVLVPFKGFNYSIEFTGGTLMQLEFQQPPDVAQLRATIDQVAPGSEIQQYGTNLEYTVRARGESEADAATTATEGVSKAIQGALDAKYTPDGYSVKRIEAVGPKVGSELRRGAMIAMLLVSLVTLAYLAFRFEWRFGAAAVLATSHDVLVTIAFISIFHIEVSLVVVGAILTLLGYSSNDTIIIFDRVREDLRKARKESLYDTLNRAINETLPRSVLTHTTTLVAILAILIFAGEVLRPFAWVMTFGVFVATFSSIYVAGPILLYIERKYPRAAASKGLATATQAKATSRAESPVESRNDVRDDARTERPGRPARSAQRPATR